MSIRRNSVKMGVTFSVSGCIAQYYFFFSMGATECILLAVMAYDRYLAICNPLRYSLLMRIPVCLHFSAGFWTGGFITHLVTTILISHLNFCDPQKINHFFCDSDPIYKLSCSDTFLVEVLGYTCSSVVILSSFLLTMSSYEHMVVTIIRLSSLEAQKKAFSTCTSHLTVVTIYYGTIIFANVRPPAKYNFTIGKVVSMFYCVVILLVFLVPFAAVAELFVLTAMSIDRYAAIFHPLHYELIMNRGLCVHMKCNEV
ncbi:Olfactory Receptor 11L1 [Manis pentadactyla]|nr:Olfactory Receptor 11L1 [Manis pentadactyla]